MGTATQRQFIFLLIILILTFILSFLVLKNFLLILALGAVFAVAFQPIMNFFASLLGNKRALAALLTTIIVITCIIVPLALIGTQIVFESLDLFTRLRMGGVVEIDTIIADLSAKLPAGTLDSINARNYLEQGLQWIIAHMSSFFGNVIGFVARALLFLVILYYLLKDGDRLRKYIITSSPLSDSDDEVILTKLTRAINSVMRGRVLLAVIQGILATIGMAIFGVPNPALWCSLTAVAALIPGIGTALVMLPVTLYVFWQGSLGMGIGFLVWGIILVGLIDNLLGPKLLGRGTQVHPLLILLSVLGGVAFFGPLGFLFGPLVISLLFALLEILFTMSSVRSNTHENINDKS